MKTLLVTAFILLNYLQGFTQKEFAPKGANWYYSKPNDAGNPLYSYEKYVAGGDTLVDGKTCRIIKSQNFTEVMYAENNKVYYHFKDKFRLIYDFGVTVGDTVGFDFKSFSPSQRSYSIDTTYTVNCVVERIDTVLVNNNKLRRISTSVIQIDSLTHIVWPGRYVYMERVGYEYDFMFVLSIPSVDYMHNLRCYNDEVISFSTEWWKGQKKACDYSLLSSVPCNTINSNTYVFPNPATDEITITTDNHEIPTKYIRLYDSKGKIIMETILDTPLQKLYVSQLPNGVYYISIYSSHHVSEYFKIIKL